MKLDKIKKLNFLDGNFGLEKEVFRINSSGVLSSQKHPFKFKWNNPYFQIDFLESQLEIVTPKANSLEKAFNFMKLQTEITYEQLAKDELLLNYSLPLESDDENLILGIPGISKKGRESNNYRKYLSDKYGRDKISISGIHFNFSFSDEFFEELAKINESDPISLKTELYFKGYQKYMMHFPVITYLFGSTPFIPEKFKKSFEEVKKSKKLIKHIRSYRTSDYGFPTNGISLLDCKDYEQWTKSVDLLIKNSNIIGRQEIYQPIRMKTANKNRVDYLEIRNIDLNPSEDYGINIKTLKFIHLFLVFLILEPTDEKNKELTITSDIYKDVLKTSDAISLGTENHKMISEIKSVLQRMKNFYKKLNMEEKFIKEMVDKETHSAVEVHKHFNSKELIVEKMLNVKNSILENGEKEVFGKLELSTKILMKEALKNGVLVEVWSEEGNLLKFSNEKVKWSKEYVVQATRTRFDSELSAILVNDKTTAKKIIKESGVQVPSGETFTNKLEALKAWDKFKEIGIVIKPNDANFSKGLTILHENKSRNKYRNAVNEAFSYSKKIIIENIVKGQEYRFLVINGKVSGVLERRPANVIGDGKSSIAKLIKIKNQSPLRGTGYKKPLEKIVVNKLVRNNLARQKLRLSSKPSKNLVVWLRYNSNVSSGGDTIDVTEKTHINYKKLAIQISKLFNLKIAGIDMITLNHKIPGPITVLEVNNNPAIHIHHHPLEGKPRNVALDILKLLELL